jgi:anti-sigma factor RsiW
MRCEEARDLVGPFVDGELTGQQKHELEIHVASCPTCTELADDYRSIGRQLRAGYQRAPVDLADTIRTALARERPAASHSARDRRQLLQRAAVLLLTVGATAFLTWVLAQNLAEQALVERDVVVAHVRSLIQEAPFQIASSDRHTVKPWFNGRVDFAPQVKDLAADGFPLAGGRLDVIGDRRVAAVIYKRRQHLINVFMWPTAGIDSPARAVVSKGYNVLTWTAGGTTYWAVSDLNAAEMTELQKLLL